MGAPDIGAAWRERAGIVATVAAALASAGDLLLLAVATAPGVDGSRAEPALVCGYYLGVLAIPLYALGYWDVGRRLPPRYGRAVVALGTCGAILGATIHGVTGAALHARSVAGIAAPRPDDSAYLSLMPFAAYLLPLWAVVAVALLAGSLLFAVPVLRGESVYPRWMALASPAVLIAAIAACASASAWSRTLIAPASPNLAHTIFFALATLTAGGSNDQRS
jgi:hypothetical protein